MKFRLGKNHSQETKDRIGKSNKGKKHSDRTKNKMRISHLNKPLSKDHVKKIIESKKISQDPRSKIIIDLYTGIFYNSENECSKLLGYNRSTLRKLLSGKREINLTYC